MSSIISQKGCNFLVNRNSNHFTVLQIAASLLLRESLGVRRERILTKRKRKIFRAPSDLWLRAVEAVDKNVSHENGAAATVRGKLAGCQVAEGVAQSVRHNSCFWGASLDFSSSSPLRRLSDLPSFEEKSGRLTDSSKPPDFSEIYSADLLRQFMEYWRI